MDAPFILDNFFIKQVSVMEKDSKIYVAGHRGMVGSAIVRELRRQGYMNIITRTHRELDLCRQDEVERFFVEEKPEYVFLAAAKVGGILLRSLALLPDEGAVEADYEGDYYWLNNGVAERCVIRGGGWGAGAGAGVFSFNGHNSRADVAWNVGVRSAYIPNIG